MEAMKIRMVLMGVMIMAASMIPNVAAADAPAPGPSSDAATFAPAAGLASVMALVFGFLF